MQMDRCLRLIIDGIVTVKFLMIKYHYRNNLDANHEVVIRFFDKKISLASIDSDGDIDILA